MCGSILAILVIPGKTTHIASRWHSDLSGIPITKRRAYGRILQTPFVCQDATIKPLKPIPTLASNGSTIDQAQLFALTIYGDRGTSAIVYFTMKPSQAIDRLDYRRKPSDQFKKGSVPSGITSIQFTGPDPKTDRLVTHTYKQSFSARVALSSGNDSRLTGSLIIVFPDSQRSFVSGSFKARLVE